MKFGPKQPCKMKFGPKRPCKTMGWGGELYVNLIGVKGGIHDYTIGIIYFTKSGKPRYMDTSDTSYDYTPGNLRQILERMEKK
jgi:hypothetical protein